MIAGALFTWLLWTTPTFHALPGSCLPDSTKPLLHPVTVFIERRVQSRTWIVHHVAMQASPDSFSFYWPRVRVEAEPVIWAVRVNAPGKRDSVAMGDTLADWRAWARTDSEGCWTWAK